MPFITQERRKKLEGLVNHIEPGDRCYSYYKEMIHKWRKNPRWATVHDIYREMLTSTPVGYDEVAARDLAWQVFFILEIIPYELRKREENGDVE